MLEEHIVMRRIALETLRVMASDVVGHAAVKNPGKRHQLQREAKRWFDDVESDDPLSLRFCCEMLDLSPAVVRRRLPGLLEGMRVS